MKSENLRENLQRVLNERGRAARDVSLRAGLSESAIKHILQGRSHSPKVETIRAIAEELGVPLGALTGDLTENSVPALPRQEREVIENQAELYLIRYWRALSEGERGYLLNLIRKSALGE